MSIHPSVSPWINRRHDGGAAQLEMRFSSLLVWTLVMLVYAGVTTSYSMVVTQYSYRQILSIMSNGLFSFQNSFSMRNAENLGQWNPVSFKKLNTKRLCRCAILYNEYCRKKFISIFIQQSICSHHEGMFKGDMYHSTPLWHSRWSQFIVTRWYLVCRKIAMINKTLNLLNNLLVNEEQYRYDHSHDSVGKRNVRNLRTINKLRQWGLLNPHPE